MDNKFNLFSYWNNRYSSGGNSGSGSYNEEARLKADVVNNIIIVYDIKTITEFGSGDANNMKLYKNYDRYCGYDISPYIVSKCNVDAEINHSKCNFTNSIEEIDGCADLALCLDVFMHQVLDSDYHNLLDLIFTANHKYILLYTPDRMPSQLSAEHVRYRTVRADVKKLYSKYKLVLEKKVCISEEKYFLLYEL